MFLRLISAVYLVSFVRCYMTISTSQDYYIRYQTLEINCTSNVSVDQNIMFIIVKLNTSEGEVKQQVVNIIYNEKECKRYVTNGMFTKCGDECRCTLDGKSIAYYYNVTSDQPILKIWCSSFSDGIESNTEVKRAVEPEKNITICSDPESYVNESMSIMLECRVNGGYPLANITWSCNGREITTAHVIEETFVVGQTNMTVNNDDNGRECTCTADHFLWKEPHSITIQKKLNVYFAPEKTLKLTGLQPNVTTMYEFDIMNATCSINGGNPLPNLTFKCDYLEGNKIISNTSVMAVIETNVTRSLDKILCICSANHILLHDEISRRVFLQVYYTPSQPNLAFVQSTPLLEGDSLQLECNTADRGNPPIHMYQWHKNADINSTLKEIYNYGKVTKDDNNIQLYCSVINKYTEYRNIRLESQKRKLNVEYKPRINVTEKNLTTVEGTPTRVICSANGNPEPKVQWKFESKSFGQQNVQSELFFKYTNRSHHGMYTCVARAVSNFHNELTSSVNIYLTVNYPPDVNVVTVNQNLTEGGSVIFICNASGRPDEYVVSEWIHSYHGTIIRRMQPVNENTLLLTDLTYEDIGTYTCIASNGVENSNNNSNQTGHQYLQVTGKPMKIPLFPDIPRFTAKQSSRLSANIRFFSYPNITEFQWYNLTSNTSIESSTDILLQISQLEIPYAFHNTLINLTNFAYEANVTIDKFQNFYDGYYSLVISNGKHINNFTVRISVSGPPEVPRTISYEASTSTINIFLEPGFNGGHDQIIHINYSICNHQTVIATETDVDDDTNTAMVHIGNLQPSTSYCLTIFSSNIIGPSMFNETDCCEQLIIRTREQALSQPSESAIGIIGGATGSMVGIIAVFIVVIIFIRRKRFQKDDDKKKLKRIDKKHKDTDSDEGDGLKDNPLYASSSDDIVSKDIKYSHMFKGKEQGICSKGQKKRNKQDQSTKSIELDQSTKSIELGCVYENHDDFIKGNRQVYPNPNNSTDEYKPTKNKDGLIYADLDFVALPEQHKFVIHGMENRNDYAIIDLTKRGDPLPSDDDKEE